MIQKSESELIFAEDGCVRLGKAGGGLEIYGDAWGATEDPETWSLPHPKAEVADPEENSNVFQLRLARPRGVLEDSGGLVQRRYEARGYQVTRNIADPALYTFAAYDKGALVGTLGVRLDSASGLKIDQEYGDEVNELRGGNCRLMELTRLAVAEPASSKEVLSALFHTALLFGHVVRSCTHAVIEVNPRHVTFYRRMLFFKPLGPQKHLDRVGAPAVALTLELAKLNESIERFFAKPDWQEQTNSFFLHWFSPVDADGILGRLHRLEGRRQSANIRSAAPLMSSCRMGELATAPQG